VDVAQALADLTEISSQIEAAVLFGADGGVEGSTLADEATAKRLAGAAADLLGRADALRGDEAQVTQLEAATDAGCVFVVRDGERRIAATTVPNPTVGLVFYDLKSCLRDSAGSDARPEERAASGGGAPAPEPEKPKRRRTAAAKKEVEEGDEA
jgi:predicted regulator of Ras-like GTPase activity (Roadblock/LC7/MglB family)